MKDWQERVMAERIALNEKLEKLTEVLHADQVPTGMGMEDVHLLFKQQEAMLTYRHILDDRIDRFI